MFNRKILELDPYDISDRFGSSITNDRLILDWNESTTIFSKKLDGDLIDILKKIPINYYGDVECKVLRKSLKSYLDVSADCISVFNGSDSAINIVFECIIESGNLVLKNEPDYSQVDTFILMKGGKIVTVSTENIFENNLNKIEKSLNNNQIKAFYFSNPNNPTGKILSFDEVESMVSSFPRTWFLVDEAYVEFTNETLVKLIERYNNIIIFRSFSKGFGLAGLRIGYIISNEKNIFQINKVRNGKEVNSFSQSVAVKALEYLDDLDKHIFEINRTKNWFSNKLSQINGLKVFDTHTNFILISHKRNSDLIDYLRLKNVFIRDRSNLKGMDNCSRITIGTMDEMNILYSLMKDYFR